VASIGEILLIQSQLKEGMVDDAATDAAKEKLARLKQYTLAAKEKLDDIRQRQQRRRELEKIRKGYGCSRSNSSTLGCRRLREAGFPSVVEIGCP
jgi:hypothetical protein